MHTRTVNWQSLHTTIACLTVIGLSWALWSSLKIELTHLSAISNIKLQTWDQIPTEPRSDWIERTLPARLCRPTSSSPCYDIYRAAFKTPEFNTQPLAVFIPSYVGTLNIRLNGHEIFSSGDLNNPRDLHFAPTFARLPSGLLAAQTNQLDIVLTNEKQRYQYIEHFYIAEEEYIQSAYLLDSFTKTFLPMLSTGICLTLGLLCLIVFYAGPRDPVFGWFVMIALFVSMRSTFYFAHILDVSSLTRDVLYFVGSLGTVVTAFVFSRRISGNNSSLFDQALLVLVAITAAIITIMTVHDPYYGLEIANQTVRIVSVILSAGTVYYLYQYFKTGWHSVKLWSLLLFFAAFLYVLHDAALTFVAQAATPQLTIVAPLLLVIAFCLIAGQRFSAAMNKTQAYNAELIREVALAKGKMSKAYLEIAQLRERKLIMAERQRITRDVHDGLGGRLVSLLYMARNPSLDKSKLANMATEIEESLIDLRSIIDALDTDSNQGFISAMTGFEVKIRSWLEQHEVDLEVEYHSNEIQRPVTSRWLLTVLRVVQEAISNIVRHSQAGLVKISISAESEIFKANITDDGVGYDDQTPGRGLSNMTARCSEFGGKFFITNNGHGTDVFVQLPVEYEHEDHST